MKKLTLTLFAIMAIFCCQVTNNRVQADNVDVNTAKLCGAYFISVLNDGKAVDLDKVALDYVVWNEEQNIPAIYFFQVQGMGYVAIAASDCSEPILAFSRVSNLDPNNLPPAMVAWFAGVGKGIAEAQNAYLGPLPEAKELWHDLINMTLNTDLGTKADTYLLSTQWGQGDENNPTYNIFCPQDQVTHKYSVTGCVATAMAQIMRYWKYPYVGKNYTGYYNSNYDEPNVSNVLCEANFAESFYNYDLMPNKLYSSHSQDRIQATALLNYHCGVAVHMSYGVEGSGAHSQDVPNAMKKYFKYETSYYKERSGMTTTKWIDTLHYEINHNRPLYYSATSPSGGGNDAAGHAFVCDGYQSANGWQHFFHFNWGWDGGSDNYCNVRDNVMKPQGTSYNFNDRQAIILGLNPPADSNIHPYTEPVAIQEVNNTFSAPAYPNPAHNQINIPYNVKGSADVEMQILDITGRMVETRVLAPGHGTMRLDVSRYNKGVYVYRVGGSARKFIVQ